MQKQEIFPYLWDILFYPLIVELIPLLAIVIVYTLLMLTFMEYLPKALYYVCMRSHSRTKKWNARNGLQEFYFYEGERLVWNKHKKIYEITRISIYDGSDIKIEVPKECIDWTIWKPIFRESN